MDEKQYAILKFLSEQTEGIMEEDFPDRIQSMFSLRPFQAGGFIHEMEIVLKSHKKWIEIRSGIPGYWLTEDGKLALQEVEQKIAENNKNADMEKEITSLTLESLRWQDENRELKKQLEETSLALAEAQKSDIPINAADRKTIISWQIATAVCLIVAFLLGLFGAKLLQG